MEMCTHSGTHIDAPWHYSGTMSDGSKPMTIEEVPLSWFTGRGVKLDFRALPDGHVVTAQEIEAELQDIGHTLVPGDVVLMNTAASAARGTERFVHSGDRLRPRRHYVSHRQGREARGHGRVVVGRAVRAYRA